MEQKKVAMTVHEAAEYTGIGRNNLRTLILWEKIPVIKIGKKLLIRIAVLEKFMELNEGINLTKRHEVIAVWKE